VSERYFRGHVSETGALGQPGARDAEILVENFDLLARPSQLRSAFSQTVLALGRFPIVFDLRGGGLTHVNQRKRRRWAAVTLELSLMLVLLFSVRADHDLND
jgi:hypothetical protein